MNLQVSGNSPTGQPVVFDLPALPITQPPALPAEPPAPSPAPEPPAAEPAFDGFAYAWQIGAANALVLLIVGGLWWWRRRRNDDADLTLAELES